MSNLTVRIADGITPELRRIAAEMKNPRKLMAGLGKQLEIELRKHFAARNQEPNSKGFPKKNFWRNEVRANTALTQVTDSKAVVSIASPAFAHKVFGGTVTPKRGKALSIPLTSAAYAAGSASLFPDKLIRKGNCLVDESGVAHYALVRRVTHKADSRAWPETSALEEALLARARAMLARILRTK